MAPLFSTLIGAASALTKVQPSELRISTTAIWSLVSRIESMSHCIKSSIIERIDGESLSRVNMILLRADGQAHSTWGGENRLELGFSTSSNERIRPCTGSGIERSLKDDNYIC